MWAFLQKRNRRIQRDKTILPFVVMKDNYVFLHLLLIINAFTNMEK